VANVGELDGVIGSAGDDRSRGVSVQQLRGAETRLRPKCRQRITSRLIATFAVAITVLAVSACGQSDSKKYDIAPIFPLSSDKCAKYDGKAQGGGFSAHCWVTKTECERAASDWRQAMQQSGVSDAIEFSC
jgi:hypothetical protein